MSAARWMAGALSLVLVVEPALSLRPLRAQTQGDPQRVRAGTVNWTRARQLLSRFRLPVDTSGLFEVDSELPPTMDAEDLEAMCAARQASITSARRKAEAELQELGRWSDPVTDERRAEAQRRLGCVDSYVGDMAA